MKCCLFLIACIQLAMNGVSQNVGVGIANPAERLDVNGNINVTGTIKANGVDGQPNQALMKNAAGVFVWGDLCGYKDVALFMGSGTVPWTVPPGKTRILVEAWGAGGGGSVYGGGGGGAYVAATFTVAPGDIITINMGVGGTSGSGATPGATGGVTSVVAGPNAINAGGGAGAQATFQMNPALGGLGSAAGAFDNYIMFQGGTGKPSQNSFTNNGAASYEIVTGGDGGNGGNAIESGGQGAYRMILGSAPNTIIRAKTSEGGKYPGGGGGGGYAMISNGTTSGGNSGAYGMVIIHF
jgi:hypothetical protein